MYVSIISDISIFFRQSRKLLFLIAPLLVLPILIYVFCIRPPNPFPQNTITIISRGSSLKEATAQLKHDGAIRSPFFLELYIHYLGGSTKIIAGGYALNEPQNIFTIGKRIMTGDHELVTVKITIPEGSTIVEIGDILTNSLTAFPRNEFIKQAEGKEGYLFPDTYFFLPIAMPEEVIKTMEENFSQKIAALDEDIRKFDKPQKDIVIMASIIEKEAPDPEARRMISGILWERLKIGMPLQVDATFLYINGKKTYDLSLDDLAIDSPYNTYKYPGLPIGPIGNPGLDALQAATNPMHSTYLYYLSDKEGKTYYAKSFAEHKRNREKYMTN